MVNIIFIVSVVILWVLYLILKELRDTRNILELPLSAKKSYDEELNKLEDEIKRAFSLVLVTPKGESENARKKELAGLVKKQKEILENRRKHFHIRSEYLK